MFTPCAKSSTTAPKATCFADELCCLSSHSFPLDNPSSFRTYPRCTSRNDSPFANYVVLLGQDGRIASRSLISEALKKDNTPAEEVAEGSRALKDAEKEIGAEEPSEKAKLADGRSYAVY
ncbi:hypothetical protein EI94DRAFT_1255045 [Lactarius quietus]|nr:hypothetical protein EI94DRAFT_1255045 [Lactarius quietus]